MPDLAHPDPTHPGEPAWLLRWLWLVAAACLLMIAVGGIVRLTHSGLSMTDWRPVAGILPPLSAQQWQVEFAAYQQTPEYQTVNTGMSLGEFQAIYWPEFVHRILGRVVGFVVAVPLLVGLVRRRFPLSLRPHVVGIGLLFLAQGVMGWLMVKSGLVDDPKVSPYRLALHLALALGLLAWCLTLIFQRRWPPQPGLIQPRLRMLAHGTMAAVIVQILLGALVAGYRAGHASDTFPLMHNRLIPGGMGVDDPWLANLVTNPLTIHFEHRWFAFLVMALATALFVHIRRQGGSPILRTAAMALLHMLVLQIVLGIATILTNVPIWLASLHQVGGVLVFALTCLVLQQTRQRPDP
ncbi:MAG: COX15/CtaA family protein [Gemmatimonadetes bacterium]|nr:COX15/CtaA family protein [Gemmatimonadota bacterium]